MSRIVIDLGFLKVAASFIQVRKGGALYYYSRYPKDVRRHFGGRDLKYVSLKTKDMQEALRKVAKLAAADDAEWSSLRSPEAGALGLTTQANTDAAKGLLTRRSVTFLMSVAYRAYYRKLTRVHGQRPDVKSLISWWCSLFGLKDQVLINLVTAIIAAATLLWVISTGVSLVVAVAVRALVWR
ncbi:MAG: hypothetical protein GY873_39205 [Bosea sp.]|uniref:DUF6538 domain-containing protein n=1 Tax=Bosea sp. (in: a-proteobacteria) TaxID=1871050 RepID=UPI00239B71A3|nr:hypothetical protein [Bosea sp. (in: a-proteobacteria)]MCP4740233.1 hypothetical protein [Bosea sp. (in: a-proteobacteria)]